MQTFLTIIHVFVSAFMILVILLQAGRGGGLSSLAGGGGSAVMGGRSSQTVLGKVTTASAALFMITSLTLAYFSTRDASVLEGLDEPPAAEGTVQPLENEGIGEGTDVELFDDGAGEDGIEFEAPAGE